MTAFIEIQKKSNKGMIYINDQVQNMNDCYAWFALNMEDLKKIAKRRSVASIKIYVKEQYDEIYSVTI